MPLDELRALIAAHARDDTTTAIDGVFVSLVERPTAPTLSVTGAVLAVIAQGAKRLAVGERILDYRAGQYVVASVDLPVTGRFSEASPEQPALGFGLTLRPAAIASLLLDAANGGGREDVPAATAPGIAVGDASGELIDAIVRLLRLLDRPADVPVLAPMLEREVLWRLLTGRQGATVRQLGLADSSLAHVGRAIRWIRDHYDEPFRVEQLAGLSGMSVSAFHRHFQAVTALSPIQFQKLIRLQEARLLLLSRTHDVAGAGFAVGYDSASQFSREYRRQFGDPPGRHAARVRGSAIPGHAAHALP
jgi:AraC-like DNA-binding protein